MEVKILLYIFGAIILFIHVMIRDKEYYYYTTARLKIRAFVVCLLLWPIILILSIILEIITFITELKEKNEEESGE